MPHELFCYIAKIYIVINNKPISFCVGECVWISRPISAFEIHLFPWIMARSSLLMAGVFAVNCATKSSEHTDIFLYIRSNYLSWLFIGATDRFCSWTFQSQATLGPSWRFGWNPFDNKWNDVDNGRLKRGDIYIRLKKFFLKIYTCDVRIDMFLIWRIRH